MFFSLKRKISFLRFDSEVKSILDKPPVTRSSASHVVCVSHVCQTYLYAYLIAIKTFARQVPLKKICAVDDLSLTAAGKALLRKHVPGIEILPITSIRNEHCPSGGDWEGFLTIGKEAAEHYCIQLDADTVTMGSLPEVLEAIQHNRSFTLGEWVDQEIVPVAEAVKAVDGVTSDHVQMLSEKNLGKLENAAELKYVRGCGAFAGFARGSLTVRAIEDQTRSMIGILGREKWLEWGSQQIASNLVIANTPGAIVLPVPKYASHMPSIDIEKSVFRHFIGSHRFDHGNYARSALAAIDSLAGATA
jgi:hypothetical protein